MAMRQQSILGCHGRILSFRWFLAGAAMADLLQFDEKALLNLEVTYRAPEVAAQRRELLDSLAAHPGQ